MAGRILIVDDSPGFRAAAAELLAARGFEVLGAAADGKQALAAVAGGCPDGILLDINLPGSDGFAVAASLATACSCVRSQTGAGRRRPQDTVLRLTEADTRPAELPGGRDPGRLFRQEGAGPVRPAGI